MHEDPSPKEVKMQSSNGTTALIMAIVGKQIEAASILVDKEARMQMVDGSTALMRAVSTKQLDMVSLLLKKEAKMQSSSGYLH